MTEAEKERAAVVAWLREKGREFGGSHGRTLIDASEYIERGDHLK